MHGCSLGKPELHHCNCIDLQCVDSCMAGILKRCCKSHKLHVNVEICC